MSTYTDISKNYSEVLSMPCLVPTRKSEQATVESTVSKKAQEAIAAIGSHLAKDSISSLVPMLELYPLNPTINVQKKHFKDVLSNYERIVGIVLVAIREFKDGGRIDPVVGENACQIRASMYSDITNRKDIQEELERWILLLTTTMDKLRSLRLPDAQMMSLEQVLRENAVPMEVPKYVLLIAYGYILTLGKTYQIKQEITSGKLQVNIEEKIDQGVLKAKLAEIKDGGASLAKDLVKLARKRLSESSIDYVKELLSQLVESGETERLREELKEEAILSDSLGLRSMRCLPCMEVLLTNLLRKSTPLIINVTAMGMKNEGILGGVSILYVARDAMFVPLTLVEPIHPELLASSAFVIDAFSVGYEADSLEALRKDIIQRDVTDIILANFAAHPQYGGQNKHVEPPEDPKRESLKTKALQIGLCETNPRLVRIWHIYAGAVSQDYKP
ncbi:MAG: hypothetical protein KGZ39_02440 [Simkania sp.]|nr:hypothetical protein [Simkania sp.]